MRIYTYGSKAAEKRLDAIVNRSIDFRKKDVRDVTRILEDVRKNGDRALVAYARKFDSPGITAGRLTVSREEMTNASRRVTAGFSRALNRAASQIREFHEKLLPKSWIDTRRPGTLLGQMVRPFDSAGVYVPGGIGGSTPLVSSVLMGVIPAKIAGVSRISMVTPPMKDGTVDPHLLVAAKKVGVDAIYKVGSAWAIAALAYGTETVPKADVIVGPGNIYVTLAKKIVSGTVGIDMIAGPSEILVIVDGSSVPAYAAADLLSQAEHDLLASAVMVTPSAEIAEAVRSEVKKQLGGLARKEIAGASIEKFGAIIVVPDLTAAIELANRIAPEHLELQIENPFEVIGEIRNAGAVFIGNFTPEPVGDYVAGPNHVLPTAGTARFASALSVDHFIKKTSLIHYTSGAFGKEAGDIIRIAETEGLGAHANSVRIRLKKR
jgi:histidinol dehydrogenase